MAFLFKESKAKVELINIYISHNTLEMINDIAKFENISRSQLLSFYIKGGSKYGNIRRQRCKRNKEVLHRQKMYKKCKTQGKKEAFIYQCLPYFADRGDYRKIQAKQSLFLHKEGLSEKHKEAKEVEPTKLSGNIFK